MVYCDSRVHKIYLKQWTMSETILVFLLRTREVPCLIHGPEAGYPDRFVVVFVPPNEWCDTVLKQATTASSRILSPFTFLRNWRSRPDRNRIATALSLIPLCNQSTRAHSNWNLYTVGCLRSFMYFTFPVVLAYKSQRGLFLYIYCSSYVRWFWLPRPSLSVQPSLIFTVLLKISSDISLRLSTSFRFPPKLCLKDILCSNILNVQNGRYNLKTNYFV